MRQLAVTLLCLSAVACSRHGSPEQPAAGLSAADRAFQQQLQEQFLDAKPGTVIQIPAGKHALDRVLTLRANGVTIRGAGARQEHPVVQERDLGSRRDAGLWQRLHHREPVDRGQQG